MIYLSFIISVIGQGAEMMLLSWLNFENIVLEQACTSIPYTSQFPDKKDKIYIFFYFETIDKEQACTSNPYTSLSPDKKDKIYFFKFRNYWLGTSLYL